MDTVCSDRPAEMVIHEIQYFMSLSVLKKLWKQGCITLQDCEKANVAIAERYGVFECRIQ